MVDEEKEFQSATANLFGYTRKNAKKLLLQKLKEAGSGNSFNFNDEEIELHFESICRNKKRFFILNHYQLKKVTTIRV